MELKYQEIPSDWFLPPEADDSKKHENALKAEIERYKSLEPSFEAKFSPESKQKKQSVTKFRSLSTQESEGLLARLAARFPLCTDFGPSGAQERTINRSAVSVFLGQTKEVFHPVTPDEIEKYQLLYSKWEQECAEKLSSLPSMLNKSLTWPQITLQIENVGSRPADDTLVVLDVRGNLLLRPPERQEDEANGQGDCQKKLKLSPAPSAPRGKWESIDPFSVARRSLAEIVRTKQIWSSDDLRRPLLRNVASNRDPNGLYFKEGRRGLPSKHIEYECAQWRHAQSAEVFEFDVLCPLESGTYSALLIVEVHAANLTNPKIVQIHIELSVEEISCFEIAEKMVAELGA